PPRPFTSAACSGAFAAARRRSSASANARWTAGESGFLGAALGAEGVFVGLGSCSAIPLNQGARAPRVKPPLRQCAPLDGLAAGPRNPNIFPRVPELKCPELGRIAAT